MIPDSVHCCPCIQSQKSDPRPHRPTFKPHFDIIRSFFVHIKFIEQSTMKQGLTYIHCQPQCSLVNTATSMTMLYNTQTHRYNQKYTKQTPTVKKKNLQILLLHRVFCRITSIINQHLHLYKFHIKTIKILKNTPTCFDHFRSSSGSYAFPC